MAILKVFITMIRLSFQSKIEGCDVHTIIKTGIVIARYLSKLLTTQLVFPGFGWMPKINHPVWDR
jgi:hypothetical protein